MWPSSQLIFKGEGFLGRWHATCNIIRNVCMRACMYMCVSVCVHACMCVSVCMHKYVPMYVYVWMGDEGCKLLIMMLLRLTVQGLFVLDPITKSPVDLEGNKEWVQELYKNCINCVNGSWRKGLWPTTQPEYNVGKSNLTENYPGKKYWENINFNVQIIKVNTLWEMGKSLIFVTLTLANIEWIWILF